MKKKIMMTAMAVCAMNFAGIYGMNQSFDQEITNRVSGDNMDIPTLNQELFDVMSGTYDTAAKKEIIEYLLARGANINAKDSEIPLISFAIANFNEFSLDTNFIGFLIDSGADLTMKDSLYRTPLDIAQELRLYDVYGIIQFKMLMKN